MRTDGLELSPIESHSVEDLFDYASDELVSKYIGWPLLDNMVEAENYYHTLLEKSKARTHHYWVIRLKDDPKAIGTIMIFNIDREAKHGEVGYVLHRSYWQKGIISEALEAIETYAREVLQLHKLYGKVVKTNIASAKVLEKRGYSVEGQLVDHYFIDAMYHDGIIYGKIITGSLL